MSVKLFVVGVATALAISLSAEETVLTAGPVGWRETGGISVGADQTAVLTNRIVVGSEGSFVKIGGGTLGVRLGQLERNSAAKVNVTGGTLKILPSEPPSDATKTYPLSAVSAPDFVVEKAASWFAVDDTYSKLALDSSSKVTAWYDVRETSTASPAYPYMASPTDLSSGRILVSCDSYLNRKAAYFGGVNGTYLRLKNNSSYTEYRFVHSIFFVHGVKACLGNVVGSATDPNYFFTGGAYKSVGAEGYLYNRGDTMTGAFTGRSYRNGQAFDPFVEKVTARCEVLGLDYCENPAAFSTLYSQRLTSQGRYGGDYLSEVLVFTNQLSEAQIAAVNAYLMEKWGLDSEITNDATVGVGSGGTLELTTPYDTSSFGFDETAKYLYLATNSHPVVAIGDGTIRKTGEDMVSIHPYLLDRFCGSFVLAEGKILSRFSQLVPLAPEPGKTYTAVETKSRESSSDVRGGIETSVESGVAGQIVKKGAGSVAFSSIPDGTTQVKVEEGTLSLVSRRKPCVGDGNVIAAAPAIGATFADPDVENVQVTGTISNHRYLLAAGETSGGWTRAADTGGNVGILVNPAIGSDAYWSYNVRQGNQAIYLYNNTSGDKSSIYTTVTFPAAGEYLLSWREARDKNQNTSSYAYHVLMCPCSCEWVSDASGANMSEIDHRIAANGFYSRVYQRLTVPDAGTYKFGFLVDDANGGVDYAVTMDDFRADFVTRSTAQSNVVKIPNGDFEQVYQSGDSTQKLSADSVADDRVKNIPKGWTLNQGDASTDYNAKQPPVFVASSAIPYCEVERGKSNSTSKRFARHADADAYGNFQLFMCWYYKSGLTADGAGKNNSAKTTFTVAKAGTYYLRGKVSRWNISYAITDFLGASGEVPSFNAKVSVGGTETDLGSLLGDTHIQADRIWPTPFVVASDNASVTLSIGQTVKCAAGLVDDLALVRYEEDEPLVLSTADTEYVKNGSFESYANVSASGSVTGESDWTVTAGTSDTASFWQNIGGASGGLQYIIKPFDGKNVCCIRSGSTISETLRPMEKGKYRLRIASNKRYTPNYDYNGFTVKLYNSTGSTLVADLGGVSADSMGYRTELYTREFTLAESGTYVLKIKGTVDGKYGSKSATQSCVVDAVSIKRVWNAENVLPSVASGAGFQVASGAKLNLDFTGSVDVGTLKLGETWASGDVSAATHPDWITGSGVLHITGVGAPGFTIFGR